MSLQPGRRIGPYEIIAPLGVGGMGEVYRARDTRLQRDVALKFVAPDIDSPKIRQRLVREARAASALNHPHICTVYEIGEHDGQPFIAMEYLEGHTLHTQLQSGPLGNDELIDAACQIVDALAAAHANGVVHRDLKPGNLFITKRGDAKILDFGLAKIEQSDGHTVNALTQDGATMGTAMYMSPEQARGGKTDARSDLFSFGVVLYEMATGKPAFGGLTALVYDAVLNRQPPAVSVINPGAPHGLDSIVRRLLEKDREYRFQSAGEVLEALRGLRRPASVPHSSASRRVSGPRPTPSLAVLPFANLSPDPDNEYLSDGITEEIINTLGQLPNVRVAARTSSFAFKGKSPDVAEVGAKLNVSIVLSGSVQRAGTRLRITTQLTSVADGFQLWSERYDRQADDVFAIQDEIAPAIAGKLKVELTDTAGRQGTPDLEAYQLYLKGRYHLNQRGAGIVRAIDLFGRSIAVDADYAAAHAALGESRALLAFYGYARPTDAMAAAKRDVQHALELDPALADARATLGFIHYTYDWDVVAGRMELANALALNPNHIAATTWSGVMRAAVEGLYDDGIGMCRRAYALDPLSPLAGALVVNALLMAGRLGEAEDLGRSLLEIFPHAWIVRYYLGSTLVRAGRAIEAVATLEAAVEPARRYAWLIAILIEALVADGDVAASKALYDEIANAPQPVVMAVGAAAGALGDLDAAFGWLERAFEMRDALPTLKHAAIADGVRADSRFAALMERVRTSSLD